MFLLDVCLHLPWPKVSISFFKMTTIVRIKDNFSQCMYYTSKIREKFAICFNFFSVLSIKCLINSPLVLLIWENVVSISEITFNSSWCKFPDNNLRKKCVENQWKEIIFTFLFYLIVFPNDEGKFISFLLPGLK